jgi:hypothetical protein
LIDFRLACENPETKVAISSGRVKYAKLDLAGRSGYEALKRKVVVMPFIICLLTVFLLAFSVPPVDAETKPKSSTGEETGTITGRMMAGDDTTLVGGRASFFAVEIGPPSSHGNVRRIPEAMAPIGPNGEFTALLPAGRYYIGAMSRDLSLGPGPPRQGEKSLAAIDERKNRLIVEVTGGRETNLGSITMASPHPGLEAPDSFRVTGTVSDDEGNPFAGAIIFVKINPRTPRPNYISPETGPDGRFDFQLTAGRSYYLMAKDVVSTGRPSVGEHIGTYNGPDGSLNIRPVPAPLIGKKGEAQEINIIMRKVSEPGPPEEADPDNGTEAQEPSAIPAGE